VNGLDIDEYGTITPSSSDPGTYEITYTITDGVCGDGFATTTVSIFEKGVPVFIYPDTIFCKSENEFYFPILTPAIPGAFTVDPPTGLDIYPGGSINPSLSKHGRYTITFTSAGSCNFTKSFSLWIILDDEHSDTLRMQFCATSAILEDIVLPYFPAGTVLNYFDSGKNSIPPTTALTAPSTNYYYVTSKIDSETDLCSGDFVMIEIRAIAPPTFKLDTLLQVCGRQPFTIKGTYVQIGTKFRAETKDGIGSAFVIADLNRGASGPWSYPTPKTITVTVIPPKPDFTGTIEVTVTAYTATCETSITRTIEVIPKAAVRPKRKCD
jgi:hypothetical protein